MFKIIPTFPAWRPRRLPSARTPVCAARLAVLITLVTSACAVEDAPLPRPEVDRVAFECAVQPVLARECSMPACHGNPARRLRVLAPGRMRLAAELTKAFAQQPPSDHAAGYHPALTSVEVDENFAQARSMIVTGQPVQDCPLLDRPLAVAAGGIYHAEGGDIFPSTSSADYLTLRKWIEGGGAELCQ